MGNKELLGQSVVVQHGDPCVIADCYLVQCARLSSSYFVGRAVLNSKIYEVIY